MDNCIKQDILTKFISDPTSLTTTLSSESIADILKSEIDSIIMDIANKVNIDDYTFVVYGHPRFISLLDSKVEWVIKPLSTFSGVKLNYGCGAMSSNGINVKVFSSTKKINVKCDDDVKKEFSGICIVPIPHKLSKNKIILDNSKEKHNKTFNFTIYSDRLDCIRELYSDKLNCFDKIDYIINNYNCIKYKHGVKIKFTHNVYNLNDLNELESFDDIGIDKSQISLESLDNIKDSNHVIYQIKCVNNYINAKDTIYYPFLLIYVKGINGLSDNIVIKY